MAFFPYPVRVPQPAGCAEGFWAAARAHRLAIQRCAACDAWRHPPGPRCWACHSPDYRYDEVNGRGTVLSYTLVHQELVPALHGVAPYNVAIVALDGLENIHIVSNIIECPNDAIAVGMAVEVVFEDAGGYVLPRFRRRP